jgi:hypothetical protein
MPPAARRASGGAQSRGGGSAQSRGSGGTQSRGDGGTQSRGDGGVQSGGRRRRSMQRLAAAHNTGQKEKRKDVKEKDKIQRGTFCKTSLESVDIYLPRQPDNGLRIVLCRLKTRISARLERIYAKLVVFCNFAEYRWF